mgnify:CR=1 FL=1
MRSMWLSALTLTISIAAAAVAAPQGTPPTKPAGPQPQCYRQQIVRFPGQNLQWARILTGDKWITGCIGPLGECITTIWVPC